MAYWSHKMKTSSSTSSLDGLTQNDPTCFVCLELTNEIGEPLVDGKMLRKCGCLFHVHPACWNNWLASGKDEFDCPICRRTMITVVIPDENSPPLTRARALSFPYADQSFCCCIEIPNSKLLNIAFFGAVVITGLIVLIELMKQKA